MDNSTREIIDNNEIESRASSQETGSPYPEDGNGRKKSKPRERARRRHRVINSCLECRRRKLKCDKGEVCMNCQSNGRQCIYITTATDDSKFRRKLHEVKDAKDSLEQVLVGTTAEDTLQTERSRRDPLQKLSGAPIATLEGGFGGGGGESDEDGFLEPTPLAIPDAAYAADGADELDDLGVALGRMRLGERIGGLYRPRIGDEIGVSIQHQPRRHKTTAPTTNSSPTFQTPSSATSGNSSLKQGAPFAVPSASIILGQPESDVEWVTLLPPRAAADKLLEQYWTSVHPVARTLHRPTFAQRYETLWELINSRAEIPASLGAIVFAVMLSAVVSMSEEDVSAQFPSSRQDMRDRLQLGAEVALARANLLISNKTETLQAFITYLLPMCLDEISRAHSALVGLAVRLAECMGYHRDPTEYGFPPAECQVRRLIWYQICYLDWRTSAVQGPRQFIQPNGYSTRLPLEVTSASPSPPSPGATGWSDLLFSVIRFECQEMHRSCLIFRKRVDLKRLSLAQAVSKLERFSKEMHEKYDLVLNEVPEQPLQYAARVMMKLFISLLYLSLLHRYMNSVTYRIPDRLRKIVLIKGTEALEAAVELETADDLRPWAWYSRSYQQYQTALLLLFEIFTFPMRKEADRIWRCLDFVFASPLAGLTALPPVGNPPKYHEVLTQRDVKARYILCMVTQRMQEYRSVRGLRSPVTITDSMILITPERVGDNSDPNMPLNYAHDQSPEQGPVHDSAAMELSPFVEGVSLVSETPHVSQTNDGGIAQLPWLSPGPSSLEIPSTSLQTGYHPGQHYDTSITGISGSSCLHPDNAESQAFFVSPSDLQTSGVFGPEQTQEILDIDWELWDSMLPPGAFDGSLDLSDVDMQEYAPLG